MGGVVNNVATGKINCVQGAGSGGAFWGQAGQKRPWLVIFQADQEMRLDSMVVRKSRKVDQIERGITIPAVIIDLRFWQIIFVIDPWCVL